MPIELECWGGPLDGEVVRLRPGQFEVTVPFAAVTAVLSGVRRVGLYRIGKKGVQRVSADGGRTVRTQHVLLYWGEEWRVR